MCKNQLYVKRQCISCILVFHSTVKNSENAERKEEIMLMSNVVMFISFNLVKGASVSEFLLASEKLNNEFMSKQKGYISWKQLVDGETWVDLLTWETIEDAKNVDEVSCTDALALDYYSFVDQESCKVQLFTIKKSY